MFKLQIADVAPERFDLSLQTVSVLMSRLGGLDVPQFIIVDTRKKSIGTNQASGRKRITSVIEIERIDGLIFMQGIEIGRAFSFVIEEDSGVLSAAVAHHGITVSIFGACTFADGE